MAAEEYEYPETEIESTIDGFDESFGGPEDSMWEASSMVSEAPLEKQKTASRGFPPKTAITEDMENEIISLYLVGHSVTELSRHFHTSPARIKKVLLREGTQVRAAREHVPQFRKSIGYQVSEPSAAKAAAPKMLERRRAAARAKVTPPPIRRRGPADAQEEAAALAEDEYTEAVNVVAIGADGNDNVRRLVRAAEQVEDLRGAAPRAAMPLTPKRVANLPPAAVVAAAPPVAPPRRLTLRETLGIAR